MVLFPVEYDVASMLYDIINMTRFRTKENDLSFYVTVSSDIPTRLFGDDIRIKQILMNLLTNAVKYTLNGPISFRVSIYKDILESSDTDEFVTLHFEVEDSGRGIKPEEMEALFSEFERIEDNYNRSIEGTGLGIPITRKLLALMDSKLEVKSEYGRGSLFSFNLRQKVVEAETAGLPAQACCQKWTACHYKKDNIILTNLEKHVKISQYVINGESLDINFPCSRGASGFLYLHRYSRGDILPRIVRCVAALNKWY